MEKEAFSKLICIKKAKGYTNQKIIDLVRTAEDLDRLYSYLIQKTLIKKKDVEESFQLINYCQNNGIILVSYFDKIYPSKLKQIVSPPTILFTKGNLALFNEKGISIVGSRKSSYETLEWTYNCAKELALGGYVVISGGAKGADAYAHKGALDVDGKIICVLGCGIDNIYPKENEGLINDIANRGLVISEYPPLSNVNRLSLLGRNRLTSGLGDGLLLVTAEISGGSLSQYKVAVSQKKEVFCPNPSLDLTPNEGIIHLIKNDKINVIHKTEDIIKNLKKQLVLESFG